MGGVTGMGRVKPKKKGSLQSGEEGSYSEQGRVERCASISNLGRLRTNGTRRSQEVINASSCEKRTVTKRKAIWFKGKE